MSGGNPEDFRTRCTPANAAQSLWSRDPSVWGQGYLSAYPPDQFALLEQFTPYATIWRPTIRFISFWPVFSTVRSS